MNLIEDRSALHEALDIVIDAIAERSGYVAMDLSTYGLGVRAAPGVSEPWDFYLRYTSIDTVNPERIREGLKKETSTTVEG